jgi:hypothetical protein
VEYAGRQTVGETLSSAPGLAHSVTSLPISPDVDIANVEADLSAW